ncbi:MAG: hypothetical protein AAGF12_24980 [Myxococcota bacterium]
MDDLGNALAVWQQGTDIEPGIWSARFTPVGGWESAVRLGNACFECFPVVAFDEMGRAMAVWSQPNAGGQVEDVAAARFE